MIIVRYLIKETLKSQLAIALVLFLVFLSQKFIRVLADASDGDIPANMVISIVGLNIPTMALLMLPLSLYIGILFTFGRLYAESEITVMNATGIGNRFLIRAALYLALLSGGLAALNSFWLAPWSQDKVAELLDTLSSENTVELLQKGVFLTAPDGSSVIFIDDIKDKKLKNVFVAQTVAKDSVLPSVVFSKSGNVKELNDGRLVISMHDGTRYEGMPTKLDYMITNFEQYEGLIGQRAVRKSSRDWEAIPTHQLIANKSPYAQAELQWRISLVVCIPLLVMLVVPLSSVNPRQGRFTKLVPAILIYLTYFLSISAMKSALEDGSVASYIGMWPINALLLITAIAINFYDTNAGRKLRDALRKKLKRHQSNA